MAIASAALAVSVVGTTASIIQQRKSSRFRKRAARVERKRNALEARRARIKTIEEFRIANGLAENTGAQSGAAGSSGFAALQSSLSSQLGSNISFNNQLENFAIQQGSFLSKANRAADLANTFSQISSFAQAFAVSQSKSK